MKIITKTDAPGGGFTVLVANYGKPARLLAIRHVSKFIGYSDTNKLPCDCTGQIKFEFYYNDDKVPFGKMDFIFEIIYSCELNYKYKATISGTPVKITLPPAKLMPLEEAIAFEDLNQR